MDAAAGRLGDWHMPDFIDEFIAKYPNFLPERCDLVPHYISIQSEN